jgi:hypothetical protein
MHYTVRAKRTFDHRTVSEHMRSVHLAIDGDATPDAEEPPSDIRTAALVGTAEGYPSERAQAWRMASPSISILTFLPIITPPDSRAML